MPSIDDILSSGRRRRRAPEPTLSQLEALTPREGPLTALALAAPRAAMTVLDALDYVDSTTRAGIGALAGVEGSGRETIFGNAPSGRELLGLGEGERGTFESGDVPGLAAELTLSPFNLLSLGTTTAAGQSAKSLARLGRAESAYRAMGLAEKADALLPRIAALEGEPNATPAPPPKRGRVCK